MNKKSIQLYAIALLSISSSLTILPSSISEFVSEGLTALIDSGRETPILSTSVNINKNKMQLNINKNKAELKIGGNKLQFNFNKKKRSLFATRKKQTKPKKLSNIPNCSTCRCLLIINQLNHAIRTHQKSNSEEKITKKISYVGAGAGSAGFLTSIWNYNYKTALVSLIGGGAVYCASNYLENKTSEKKSENINIYSQNIKDILRKEKYLKTQFKKLKCKHKQNAKIKLEIKEKMLKAIWGSPPEMNDEATKVFQTYFMNNNSKDELINSMAIFSSL